MSQALVVEDTVGGVVVGEVRGVVAQHVTFASLVTADTAATVAVAVDDRPVTVVGVGGPVPTTVVMAAATLEVGVTTSGGKDCAKPSTKTFPSASPTLNPHALLFAFVVCVPYNADRAPHLDSTSLISPGFGCQYAHFSSVFPRTLSALLS